MQIYTQFTYCKNIFEYMEILESACIEKANRRLESQLDSEFSALSIANPQNGQ